MRLFWTDIDVFIFHNRHQYFATLKPQLKDNTSVWRRSI